MLARAFLKSSATFILPGLAVSGFLAALGSPALANPLGGTVTTGSATIANNSRTTTVRQSSEGVVIDWSSFNVSSGQTTSFAQPNAQAIAVNRIGGTSVSRVLGTLDANGRVVLINGNGLLFGKNAKVDVGSLIATSTDGSDSDVLADKFTKSGNLNASVINRGAIAAANHGTVALVAPNVTNRGIVSAKFGTISLDGANAFTVDFSGDGLVSFAAQGDVNGNASVINSGKIAGATVSLTARAANGIATGTVKTSGIVEARNADQLGGTILLDAGQGGDVEAASARIDASAASGGGSIMVGSWNDASVVIGKRSTIDASSRSSGDGGTIDVLGQATSFRGRAIARGGMSAGDGGSIETSGHVVDTWHARFDASAPNGVRGIWSLDPPNLTISSGASVGVSVSGGVYTPISDNSVLNVKTLESALANSDVEVSTDSSTATSYQLGEITISAPLKWAAHTLTLDAFDSIYIDASMSASGTAGLALNPNGENYYNPAFAGNYHLNGGRISFANAAQSLSIGGQPYTLVNSIASLAADVASHPNGNFALSGNLNASQDGTYVSSPVSTIFGGTFAGLGNTISHLTIVDPQDADVVGLFAGFQYATIRDLMLSGFRVSSTAANSTSFVGGLVGVNTFGQLENVSGSVLVVGGSAEYVGGLVGQNNQGTLTDVSSSGTVEGLNTAKAGGLVGQNATEGKIYTSYSAAKVEAAKGTAGGLVGENDSLIQSSYATGAIAKSGVGGGLVGYDNYGGDIENSYATGEITTQGWGGGLVGLSSSDILNNDRASGEVVGSSTSSTVGGLVGRQELGTISTSSASGSVTGKGIAGGLAGFLGGWLLHSTASGNVSGREHVGGLVGDSDAEEIEYSSASGSVTGTSSSSNVGGLVGYDDFDSVVYCFSTGSVTDLKKDSNVGGLSGYAVYSLIGDSYATGGVIAGSGAFAGGFVGFAQTAQTQLGGDYSTGTVSAGSGSKIGGFVGDASGISLFSSYWDTTTSGITNLADGAGNVSGLVGVTGLTTAQLESGLPAGFDPTVWSEGPSLNNGLPYLLNNLPAP